jgi:hypothetical protein
MSDTHPPIPEAHMMINRRLAASMVNYRSISGRRRQYPTSSNRLRFSAAVDFSQIFEVIEEFWGPYYQRFRGGMCEINQHATS